MGKRRKKSREKFSYVDMVISLYLCLALGIFPLLYKRQYAGMGDFKYSVFVKGTILFLAIAFVMLIPAFIQGIKTMGPQIKREGFSKWKSRSGFETSILDKGVFLYFLCTTLSFLFSAFRKDVWMGAEGWEMGYRIQILFVLLYFLVSHVWKWKEGVLWIFLASSFVVFLGAVLHRFDVDFLNIYGNLELKYKVQFLSTMGQSSWYSSFLCTVFPVGLYLFFSKENGTKRILSGCYSALAMCSLVTQNTDSAFLSLFAVLFLLFYLSFDGKNERDRFLEVLLLVFGSFTFMGICQRIWADRMIPLDKMSIIMSQSPLAPCLLLVTAGIYFFCRKGKKDPKRDAHKKQSFSSRKGFWFVTITVAAGVLGMVLFIVLNSNGFLYTHFGYQNVNNYLLFSDTWGNGRGFAWKYTFDMWKEMSLLQKCVGVGPDGYSFFAKSIPALLEKMVGFWGNLVLTNAHNEYLTKLVDIGIFGLVSYLGMLISAVFLFIKDRKENKLLPAFALCVAAYAVHNLFCYEQICCTPFFYILLGIGSSLQRRTQKR